MSKLLVDSLKCYHFNNKIRLGKDYDGGYVIGNLYNNYDLFISCGISDDISFEEDFINKYNNICYAFDGTINDLPHKNNKIIFHKINIGKSNTNKTTNLHDLINKNNNIFLKIDIEGYEYEWINSLSNEQLNKFKQIVIEIHLPFDQFKYKIMHKLANNFYLIHIHGNNFANTKKRSGYKIPCVFECTYLRKDKLNLKANKLSFPTKLDMPNNPNKNDILLNKYPYIH